ncbi:MAG: prolyl aminopeptidase [Bradymonadales bacterium]|nr:MAG: prolyl aminopeptidase [Bradymonadales bacterium]
MNATGRPQRELYAPIEAYRFERIRVSGLHELYFEEAGNPQGKPVIFLHGGPGGGCQDGHRRFFDPKKYRIILLDQRGAGKSRPLAETRENSTWDLVDDLEQVRKKLSIDRWQVFGGSWGSTLALAYASAYPERITELVLRGIFLLRKKEIHWFYQEGASKIFPEAFAEYSSLIPAEERSDLVAAYGRRLGSSDPQERLRAAKAWTHWELQTSQLAPAKTEDPTFGVSDEFCLAFACIENHYFRNLGFFKTDDYLLQQVERYRHIPAVIVHGRYDVVCPVENAYELAQKWPEAELKICPQSGHSVFEREIISELISATDRFAEL